MQHLDSSSAYTGTIDERVDQHIDGVGVAEHTKRPYRFDTHPGFRIMQRCKNHRQCLHSADMPQRPNHSGTHNW